MHEHFTLTKSQKKGKEKINAIFNVRWPWIIIHIPLNQEYYGGKEKGPRKGKFERHLSPQPLVLIIVMLPFPPSV